MKIAVDFDGTCVTHEYPNMGKDIGAARVLKRFVADGHLLILYTMRSGPQLEDAINWFRDNDIPLYSVNKDQGQEKWTQSPKAYANLYIDDAALGCPLLYPIKGFLPPDDQADGRPYVDWEIVEKMFYDEWVNTAPDPVVVHHIGKESPEVVT